MAIHVFVPFWAVMVISPGQRYSRIDVATLISVHLISIYVYVFILYITITFLFESPLFKNDLTNSLWNERVFRLLITKAIWLVWKCCCGVPPQQRIWSLPAVSLMYLGHCITLNLSIWSSCIYNIYVYNRYIYIVQLYNIVWSSWSRHSILISCKFIFWVSAVLFLVVLQCSLTILKDSSNKSSWGMSGYSIYTVNLRLESNSILHSNWNRSFLLDAKNIFRDHWILQIEYN